MPTISSFYGIFILMFWDDHVPPHFHARYGESEAVIEILTLQVIHGAMPRHQLALIRKWVLMNREKLMEDWQRCVARAPLQKIPPLP